MNQAILKRAKLYGYHIIRYSNYYLFTRRLSSVKIICRQNCSGKTKELIKESLETGNPILALTPMKMNSLKEKSQAYFGEDVEVIDFIEAQTYQGNILLDDVDKVLPELIKLAFRNNNLSLSGITMSI